MSLKVPSGFKSIDSSSHVAYNHLDIDTKASPLGRVRAGGNYYFSNKIQFASAGASDAPQAGIHPAAADEEVVGAGKLKQMKEQGLATPRMDYSGSEGGVRWGALLDGVFFGKPVSEKAGSYHSWHQEGLFFRQSGAPTAVAEAALDASDLHAVVGGVGAAPITGGLSLLAAAGGLVAMAIKLKAKRTSTASHGTAFVKATPASVRSQIDNIRAEINSLKGGIDEAVARSFQTVFRTLASQRHALSPADAVKLRQIEAQTKSNPVGPAQAEKLYREWLPQYNQVATGSDRVAMKTINWQIQETRNAVAKLQQQRNALESTLRSIE